MRDKRREGKISPDWLFPRRGEYGSYTVLPALADGLLAVVTWYSIVWYGQP